MRVTAWTAAFALMAAIVSTTGLTLPAAANPAKAMCACACPCGCPVPHKAAHIVIHPAHHAMRHVIREDYAENDYYSYESASSVDEHEWHGEWREAPDETPMPPAYYGPAGGYYYEGMQVDGGGWTGGVGYGAEAEGGFMDGFGMMHFSGGGFPNGPTFNSSQQSFVPNPSMPGPFRGGGFAPGRAR